MSTNAQPHCLRLAPCIILAVSGFLATTALAQLDGRINKSVWKQKFGVLDAQMSEQAPYAGWLSQDADGDGISNRNEFIAGTNPFKTSFTEAHFRPPSISSTPSSLSLTFPTVPGKLYGAESNMSLVDTWSKGSLPTVVGDGTPKTIIVPKSAGKFFHITVTDQSTQGDQVSDWAKHMLGLSPAAPITSQSSFNASTLAASLEAQNIVSLGVIDSSGTQPTDSSTPAGDYALIRITRSGYMSLGDVTVPLVKSGTAEDGVDIVQLPTSVTFPAGVNSVDLAIHPVFNASRTASCTVFLTAAAPDVNAAAGNYTLGSQTSAGVTIYPAGITNGSGLTATYFPSSSSSYTSLLNFGGLAATYNYTKINTTTGTALVTYSGTAAVPLSAGSQVTLQATSGRLDTTPFSTPTAYTIVNPVTANSFTVDINATSVPSSGTGNITIVGGGAPVTRIEPTVNFNWLYGTPNGNSYINADQYSVTWEGFLDPPSAGSYTFQLDADDKARVLIDTGSGLQQILENGWDTPATGGYKQSAPIALNVPAAPGGRYPIRVEFVETTGEAKCKLQWKGTTGNFANISSNNIWTDNTTTTALNRWNGSYYDNPTFTPPAVRTQTDTAITNGNNGDWGSGTPDQAIPHNNFSAHWTGQLLPQYSQTYYFSVKADDGIKLWVDNQLIIDRWSYQSAESVGMIDLQADVRYDIRMEYYEGTGAASAVLNWYSNDQPKQVVPMNRLFPNTTAAPSITSPTNAVTILGAAAPFSMEVTGSNGSTVSSADLPGWLTLANGVLSGTPPAAGIYQFTLTATNGSGTSCSVMTVEVEETQGQLTRDVWTSGVTGSSIASVPWTSPPSSTGTVSTADSNSSLPNNAGERLRGYFIAPFTGNYYFWIAASNAAELWISNDAEPVNKVLRASVTGGTPVKAWDAQASQKSCWLALVSGQRYYIEARHNTGAAGSSSHMSVAWFLDPSGSTETPLTNGSTPASPVLGGILPGHVLSPWDNPPTTTIPGTLYVTNLQGAQGLSGITGTGGAFLRVNGSSAVLQLNYSGLTSGAISKKIYNSADQVIFDIDAQDKNYPTLKTSDGGYSWTLQAADLADLNNGGVYIGISTIQNPGGELTGTFGITAGSQTAPATPAYPSWTDNHATSDAENSRFLTQATFGPNTADMNTVKSIGYQQWIENQIAMAPTKNLPFILDNLSADPQNPYGSSLMFNSWWINAITAPDQLRQRAAFALSEILVVSDTGPLNNNGRVLADYYDTLLDTCFGNFRDILKQVTLSPAMGVYLDMRGNAKGDITTGLHPNENYAREILQLFSAGLYRTWPDGSLVLDSKGYAVPTYDQSVITGMARVFTGWTWGQALLAGDRLPTSFSPSSNYLDPMVLVPTKHELGSKILLDNVVLPPAVNTDSATSLVDPTPIYIQTTDPNMGQGNLVTTPIYNQYDLNGLKDLEATLDNIMENSAVGPYICRQLIQRLVTSHPKRAYVQRVVRAFNGERNVDGVATGVRGDMAEVFRAILLDYEARSSTAAADPQYGKQREPLLRVTGPARALAAASFPNSTYSQSGTDVISITTPTDHRFRNGDTVLLENFSDSGSSSSLAPSTKSYSISNVTANSFTVANSATSAINYTISGNTAKINPSEMATGGQVYVKFTTGGLAGGAYDKVYTLGTLSGGYFTINLDSTPASSTAGSALVPKLTSGYNATDTLSILIQTTGNHNLDVGDNVQLYFKIVNQPLPAQNGVYAVTSVQGPNSFRVTPPAPITKGSEGGNSVIVFPLKGTHWLRTGTVTVTPSTWSINKTDSNLNQTPLNSTTVFNYFYPDYQYPGEMAQAGMTTPEFQLTDDSNTMNLTNLITQGTQTNNPNQKDGYINFFNSNAIVMDYAPYMTPALTDNAAIPALVENLNILLASGNLTSAVKDTISNYVANNSNFPMSATPTNEQMRNRVRAIVNLITISAEYAIQK